MKCPVCTNTDLVMSERQGIEIDYCPACRGIWLDRGELDKMIDKVVASEKNNSPVYQQPPVHYNEHKQHNKYAHKHYKKHWLSDLFD